MAVILEQVSHPSEQDELDLKKIYADFPLHEGQPFSLNKARGDIYAGRMNDQLLGAFEVADKGSHVVLIYLCVRKEHRHRHVARDMLRQFLKGLTVDCHLMEPKGIDSQQALHRLLSQLGFKQVEESWVYKVKNTTND
ncbi:MAG: acetyl-CoA sensor PanZ family protein [Cellvibrionales bacterium]|nr:acetyl-CoA sensor PanZ family protein [Cellvibrionales bacterium]